MGTLMKVTNPGWTGLVTEEAYKGSQCYLQHGQLSLVVSSHSALSIILVAIDQQPRPRSEIQEPEYMTTGKRSDECFLWIDRFGHGKGQLHDAR